MEIQVYLHVCEEMRLEMAENAPGLFDLFSYFTKALVYDDYTQIK